MDKLDSDDKFLFGKDKRGQRIQSRRDCVQFLAYDQMNNDPAKLTRELLRELPEQICSYFDDQNIKPGEKKSANVAEARENFQAKEDLWFPSVSKRLEEEAIDEGANSGLVKKLLEKEKNPDFRKEWIILNAPRVTDEAGLHCNKIRA